MKRLPFRVPPKRKRAARLVWSKLRLGYTIWAPASSRMAFIVPEPHIINGVHSKCRVATLEYLEDIKSVVRYDDHHEDGRPGDSHWRLANHADDDGSCC